MLARLLPGGIRDEAADGKENQVRSRGAGLILSTMFRFAATLTLAAASALAAAQARAQSQARQGGKRG